VRYRAGAGTVRRIKEQPALLAIGHAEVLREGSTSMIWALGNMVQDALRLAERLRDRGEPFVGVVNARS